MRAPAGRPVLILAAASTIDALGSALDELNSSHGIEIRASYGPTSTLARQVVAGAPADLLLAASTAWANYVAERRAVAVRGTVAGNRLVIVVPRGSWPEPCTDLQTFVAASRSRRIAIADPEAVPAGIYAREALEHTGLWGLIEPSLLPTLDVRAALALAASGEADAAFVYASDAAAADGVEVVLELDESAHSPIEYPLLLLEPENPNAVEVFDFLVSEEGVSHFLDRGFTAPHLGRF